MPGLRLPRRRTAVLEGKALLKAAHFQLPAGKGARVLQFLHDTTGLGIRGNLHPGETVHHAVGIATLHEMKTRLVGAGPKQLAQVQHCGSRRQIADEQFHEQYRVGKGIGVA